MSNWLILYDTSVTIDMLYNNVNLHFQPNPYWQRYTREPICQMGYLGNRMSIFKKIIEFLFYISTQKNIIVLMNVKSFISIPWYSKYLIKISTNEVLKIEGNIWKALQRTIWKYWHLSVAVKPDWEMITTKWIHQLVMLIKEWPCPRWKIICHNDGNPWNNHPDNLRYDTHVSNTLDSIRHWTHKVWISRSRITRIRLPIRRRIQALHSNFL